MQPLAIVIAGLLIGAAIMYSAPRYQIAGLGSNFVRMDTRTGEVSSCNSFNTTNPPICSEFGPKRGL
jgi:hypothetical protein